MRSKISQILPHLFVGRYQDSVNIQGLEANGITHILNVMESSRVDDSGKFQRKHVPISDFGDSALSALIQECCDFIESARSSQGTVLLHCGRGQNRSPSIATAYLMKCHGMTLKEAFYKVRDSRSEFAPHEGYLVQLQTLDQEIHGTLSLTEDEEPLSIQEITRRVLQDKTKD